MPTERHDIRHLRPIDWPVSANLLARPWAGLTRPHDFQRTCRPPLPGRTEVPSGFSTRGSSSATSSTTWNIGFAFLPAYQSKGFGYESARAVLDHARDGLRLRRVVAIANAANEVSARLLEKLGMRFEGMIQPFPAGPALRLFAVDFPHAVT